MRGNRARPTKVETPVSRRDQQTRRGRQQEQATSRLQPTGVVPLGRIPVSDAASVKVRIKETKAATAPGVT